jgi:hypothetical protein
MPKTWRGALKGKPGPRGARQRAMKNWLVRFYRTHKPDTRFTLKEFLEGCKMDQERTRDHEAAMSYLQNMRRKTSLVVDSFFGSPEYKKYTDDGLTNDQIFARMMEAAITNNIFLLRSEAAITPGATEGYRIMSLKDFEALKTRRAISIVSEIGNEEHGIVPLFLKLVERFPELGERYVPPALPATDGVFRHSCERCGATFVSQTNLVDHYIRKHAENGDANGEEKA